MKLTPLLTSGATIIFTGILLSSCATNPGGLSDEEWNSLPPAKRAELKMQQEALTEREVHDMQEDSHWNKQDSAAVNYDREVRKDLNESMKGKDLSGLNKL